MMLRLASDLVPCDKICTFADVRGTGTRVGDCITSYGVYMAIINSMGVGKARGSMGNVTYRTVRGRTIGSQKIGSEDGMGASTRVPSASQYMQQIVFRAMTMFAAAHSEDIKVSFNKTKYGSERNYFIKQNSAALKEAFAGLTEDSTLAEIESAVSTYAAANPTAIFRVKKSGYEVVYLTGEWSSEDNPTPPVPPTGASINGRSASASTSFLDGASTIVAVSETKQVTIADTDRSLAGLQPSDIATYETSSNVSGATITDVQATANQVVFTCAVPSAVDGGSAVKAFKIRNVYYQVLG